MVGDEAAIYHASATADLALLSLTDLQELLREPSSPAQGSRSWDTCAEPLVIRDRS
jgi:hypothetical protein